MLHRLPAPRADLDTAPFWDACGRHELVVQRCSSGHYRYPPGPMCPDCQSTEATWEPVPRGMGTVYSWIVVNHAVSASLADQVPYVVALIEVAEGARMISTIVDCNPGEIHADMAVEVAFEDHPSGITLPLFRVFKEPVR
jgi:uncharacterized protein